MFCKLCANRRTTAISTGKSPSIFPGSRAWTNPLVWVFPTLVVCLNRGFTEFAIPETELQRLNGM